MITPLSVLIVADTLFFPFITGKAFFFRSIIEIVFVAWLLLTLSEKEYRPHKQKIYYVLLAFAATLFVSNILGNTTYKAFWSNFERMDGWLSLIHFVMFFMVISSVFTTYKLWKVFWNVSLSTSVIVCFYGMLQHFGIITAIQGGTRIDGTFGNAAYLAVYNLFNIFIAVWFVYKTKQHKILPYIYGLIGLCNLATLYLTATRGAIIGLGLGVLTSLVTIVLIGREHKKMRFIAGLGLGLFVVLGATLFIARNSQFVVGNSTLSRIMSISLSEGGTRFTVWGMGLEGFFEKPILGWGQEGFSEVFATYYKSSLYAQEPWFDRAHNVVVDWLVAGGAIGLILYVSILFFTFLYIKKSQWLDNFEKSIFFGLIVGYVVQNLFVFDNLGSYLLFFSVLGFLTVGVRTTEKVWYEDIVAERSFVQLTKPFLALILILALYTLNYKPLRAGQEFVTAYVPKQKPELVIDAFEKALGRNTFASYEITEQMMTQAPEFLRAQSVDTMSKQRYVSVLQQSIEKELLRNKDNVRFYYALGVFYNQVGEHDKAVEILSKAHDLSPDKQIISFELSFAYIASGEEEKGMKLLKDTYEHNQNFHEARVMYVLGAIYTENLSLENNLFEKFEQDNLLDDSRILQAYINTKRYDRVISILQTRIINDPMNIQSYVSLSAAYVEVGDRSQAITILRKAIGVDPSFSDQGEKFIADIQNGNL